MLGDARCVSRRATPDVPDAKDQSVNLESVDQSMSVRRLPRCLAQKKVVLPQYGERRICNTISCMGRSGHSRMQVAIVQVARHLHCLTLQDRVLPRPALFGRARLQTAQVEPQSSSVLYFERRVFTFWVLFELDELCTPHGFMKQVCDAAYFVGSTYTDLVKSVNALLG